MDHVLALDLASTVGWCFGPIGAVTPLFGCWHLPRFGGEGGRYAAFENELGSAIERHRPNAIVLEASLSLQALAASSTMAVARQQISLRGVAYIEAYRAAIPISEIDSRTVRLELLGSSYFAKNAVKHRVVQFCRQRGWQVPDHNSADAAMVWLWHCERLMQNPPGAGPIFRAPAIAI